MKFYPGIKVRVKNEENTVDFLKNPSALGQSSKGAWVVVFGEVFAPLLLHMLEGKTYKSTVVIELKQKTIKLNYAN